MESDLMYGLRQPPRPLDGADSESDTEEEDPPMCPAGLFEHAESFFTTYLSVFARRPIQIFGLDENNRPRRPHCRRRRRRRIHWPERPRDTTHSDRLGRCSGGRRAAPRQSPACSGVKARHIPASWPVRLRAMHRCIGPEARKPGRFRFMPAFLSPLRLPHLPSAQHGIAQAVARIPSTTTEMPGVHAPPWTPQVHPRRWRALQARAAGRVRRGGLLRACACACARV
jgi:hypothetical protein